MSSINAAYHVLSDPGRRTVYDRSLRSGSAVGPSTRRPTRDDDSEVFESAGGFVRPNPLSPDGPARFPWKLMLVMGTVGSVMVLASAALADPPSEEAPDGIIRDGSCVAIEPNGDAREIACTGTDDLVVDVLVPLDATCPVGLEPHRDRLGLGVACVVP